MPSCQLVVPGSSREKKIIISGLFASTLFLIFDQASKLYFERAFNLYESIIIIDPILNFTYVRNTGAAWSILNEHTWLLLIFGIIMCAVILFYLRKLAEGYTERYYAILLLAGGIIGNTIDRLWRGAVIDFIHVHYQDIWHYPIFNIADIIICCAIGIYLLSNLLRHTPQCDSKSTESTQEK